MAFILGADVKEIYIYPFGGISKFLYDLNISIFYEFLILIMGPVFQIFAYIILINTLSSYTEMITIYHYGILFFNLLPIYPLDGGKLFNLLLSKFFSYRFSMFFCVVFSLFAITFIFIYEVVYNNDFTINLIIIVILLLYKVLFEYNQINYLFEKFLLERYLKNYNFKKSSIINDINKFKRDYHHLIKKGEFYYTEREMLEKKYKKY